MNGSEKPFGNLAIQQMRSMDMLNNQQVDLSNFMGNPALLAVLSRPNKQIKPTKTQGIDTC